MRKMIFFIALLLLLSGCRGQDIDMAIEDNGDDDNTVEIELIVEDENSNVQAPYKPVATMIENSPNARPQSGLIDADIVYELYVEGGITRFLALFMSKYPEVVGPVRSARHYYLDIVEEWDALFVHYGGSSLAKKQFSKRDIKRIDGMQANTFFWRDNSRIAPHNAYIDIQECKESIDFEQTRREIKFCNNSPIVGGTYHTVTIPYNSTFSKVKYIYDPETQKNMRETNEIPSTNRENEEQLFADNIVIQYVAHEKMDSGVGYKKIDLFGTGKAEYFIDGKHFEGTWKREDPGSITLFLDNYGDEIGFMEGNIWIHIVPTNMEIIID